MPSPRHFPHLVSTPIYSLVFLTPSLLLYTGGGGKSRTGIHNTLSALYIPSHATSSEDLVKLEEVKLSNQEDAPMCMTVVAETSLSTEQAANGAEDKEQQPEELKWQVILGINEEGEDKKIGNKHLRVFECTVRPSGADSQVPELTLKPVASQPSLPIEDPSAAYLRLLAHSPSTSHLLSASSEGRYNLQHLPSFQPVFEPTNDFEGEEIMDADFDDSGNKLVICSGKRLKVFGTFQNPVANEDDEKVAIDGSELKPPPTLHTIQNPGLGGEGGCEFRAVRFGRSKEESPEGVASSSRLFTVVNAKASSSAGQRGKKKPKRKSFLTSWHLPSCTLLYTRQISDKPVTTFAISPDDPSASTSSSLLAYGSSDQSLGIVDGETLRPLVRILDAHGFPPTCVAWSPFETAKEEATKGAATKESRSTLPEPTSANKGLWLASSSADGSLRFVRIPTEMVNGSNRLPTTSLLSMLKGRGTVEDGAWMNLILLLLLTLVITAVAIWVQRGVLS